VDPPSALASNRVAHPLEQKWYSVLSRILDSAADAGSTLIPQIGSFTFTLHLQTRGPRDTV